VRVSDGLALLRFSGQVWLSYPLAKHLAKYLSPPFMSASLDRDKPLSLPASFFLRSSSGTADPRYGGLTPARLALDFPALVAQVER
jgi:hypothetical protein